jgi:protein TonB
LTSHATIVRQITTDPAPESTTSTADVVPIPTAWQPSRYGEKQRPNLFAMIGSVAIVGGLLSALLATNVVSVHKARNIVTVVEMLPQPEPPPPPPPQHQPKPVMEVRAPSPVVAPRPLVTTPAPPVQIATSPTAPPPEAQVAGPPSPVPQAAAPGVENAGDLSSKMVSATPPRYPNESRRRHEQGVVVLMVLVGVDGSVADISISQSSGYERLDRAAMAAVQRWRWSPTRRGGTPVMLRGLVEIPFVLKS